MFSFSFKLVAPICKSSPNIIQVMKGEMIQVPCELDAYPTDLTFFWTFNGSREITYIPASNYVSDRLKSSIIFCIYSLLRFCSSFTAGLGLFAAFIQNGNFWLSVSWSSSKILSGFNYLTRARNWLKSGEKSSSNLDRVICYKSGALS